MGKPLEILLLIILMVYDFSQLWKLHLHGSTQLSSARRSGALPVTRIYDELVAAYWLGMAWLCRQAGVSDQRMHKMRQTQTDPLVDHVREHRMSFVGFHPHVHEKFAKGIQASGAHISCLLVRMLWQQQHGKTVSAT